MRRGRIDMAIMRRLCERHWPVDKIAEAFGVTPSAVAMAKRRAGIIASPRARMNEVRRAIDVLVDYGRPLDDLVEDHQQILDAIAEERGDKPPRPPKKAKPPPVFSTYPPGWNADRDCLVLATCGTYEKIAKLAARLDMPTSRVLARYHRISRG